ncbi:Gfo/Idh/MocA family oxidoreductase [Microbacterium sp. NPDC076911]|uniref:Gfo/Idh/MocA family protein n=1 Tax=Microbacterium sp. NPDC076911 TaxID=3154958 RepID=UPI003424F8FE
MNNETAVDGSVAVMRVGLLGASGIAPRAIIAPSKRRTDALIVAVASRSEASEYAQRHGIARVHADYQTLIDDAEVDLVYIALPPSEHARWTIAALEAGKNVLCEKPFAMNAVEAGDVAQAVERTGRRVVEAFHDYYHPLFQWVREFVASGELGSIDAVTAEFNAEIPFDRSSIRHAPELGGGALMDLGCYPLHWLRSLFGEPAVLEASAELNPLGADLSIVARLDFGDGIEASLGASMAPGIEFGAFLHIVGSKATLHVDNLVFPSAGHSIVVTRDGLDYTSTVAGQETYDHQLAAVLDAFRTGESLATEIEDSVRTMRVIDDIYRVAGVR